MKKEKRFERKHEKSVRYFNAVMDKAEQRQLVNKDKLTRSLKKNVCGDGDTEVATYLDMPWKEMLDLDDDVFDDLLSKLYYLYVGWWEKTYKREY